MFDGGSSSQDSDNRRYFRVSPVTQVLCVAFTLIFLFHSHSLYTGVVIIPVLQMGGLRLRGVLSHSSGNRWSWYSNPGLLTVK